VREFASWRPSTVIKRPAQWREWFGGGGGDWVCGVVEGDRELEREKESGCVWLLMASERHDDHGAEREKPPFVSSSSHGNVNKVFGRRKTVDSTKPGKRSHSLFSRILTSGSLTNTNDSSASNSSTTVHSSATPTSSHMQDSPSVVSKLFGQMLEVVPPGGNISVADAVSIAVRGCAVQMRDDRKILHLSWFMLDPSLCFISWAPTSAQEESAFSSHSNEGEETVAMRANYLANAHEYGAPLGTVKLSGVSKVRAYEREILLEFSGDAVTRRGNAKSNSVDVVFDSRERAYAFCRAICAMCAPTLSISSKYKRSLHIAPNFSLLGDTLGGEPLSSKEHGKGLFFLDVIGEGACGKVYLAFVESRNCVAAVKALSKNMIRKQQASIPFKNMGVAQASSTVGTDRSDSMGNTSELREVEILRKLRHENIVQLYDAQEDARKRNVLIVLEFLPRGSVLSSAKAEGATPLDENTVGRMFADVIDGVQYMHSQNIVHRDIKPDNLLVGGDGTVKLSDFGTATQVVDSGSIRGGGGRSTSEADGNKLSFESASEVGMRMMVGTPIFIAPENCLVEGSSRAGATFASDMWALGTTLYFMLFGRAPFVSTSLVELQRRICNDPLQVPPPSASSIKISDELRDLLSSLLDKDPSKRPTASETREHPWVQKYRCEVVKH